MENVLPPLNTGLDLVLGLHITNVAARTAKELAAEHESRRFFIRAEEKQQEARDYYSLKNRVLLHMMERRKGDLRRVIPDDTQGFLTFVGYSMIGCHGFHAPMSVIGSMGCHLPRVGPQQVKAFIPKHLPAGYSVPAVTNALEAYLDSGCGALTAHQVRSYAEAWAAQRQQELSKQ